jgi:hypothetical protein
MSRKFARYATIVSVFFIVAAPIVGMVGCGPCGDNLSPSQNLQIWDWYDLNAIRDNLAGNHTLMDDLDSTTPGFEELASPTANQGKGWEQIGSFYTAPFTGSFDGQGYQIRDLSISRPHEGNPVGLFSFVGEAGTIQNVGVVNVTVTSDGDVGALAGQNDGTVSNSYSTGTVTGDFEIGGLVGLNYGTIGDSYSASNVTGEGPYVGGLVGLNGFVGQSEGTITNSYCIGIVIGDVNVGGMVGHNDGAISNSFWDTQTSGQATSDGGMGKTTVEMKDIATFSGAAWEICAVTPGATNPAYTWNIVDDETYPFLSWQPVSTSQNQEPIEIASVLGPIPPFTPAGPAVEITLKTVGVEPVISLTATLEVLSASGIPFDFTFDDVSPSNPLQPDTSTSDTHCLI